MHPIPLHIPLPFPMSHSIIPSMASSLHLLLVTLLFATSPNPIHGFRKLSSLYNPPPPLLTYHHGHLLEGNIPISILWYGHFTSAQKSILSDFVLSLTPNHPPPAPNSPAPTVSRWWSTVDEYLHIAGRAKTHVSISSQTSDEGCSLGKSLTRQHISMLASVARPARGGIAVVLTSADVAVEGFCMSNCGLHGSDARTRTVYVWVGNSAEQCPGQCAWPFHQPVYGPQGPALASPNGDVGADGMVISLAALLAGATTNPFGGGFFQVGTAVEVAAACPGVYGRGAYPGYAGELRVDGRTGGSYNVEGVGGRKYLVPAMFDPSSKSCLPMV